MTATPAHRAPPRDAHAAGDRQPRHRRGHERERHRRRPQRRQGQGAGATVVFPAGTYSHATLAWPDDIDLRGAGAGRTVLNFALRFGSGSRIGDGTEAGGATIGAASTFYLLSGAHGTTLQPHPLPRRLGPL